MHTEQADWQLNRLFVFISLFAHSKAALKVSSMKWLADKVLTTAQDVKELASRLLADSAGFLRSSIGSLPLIAGTRVLEISSDVPADETHYFLIPLRTAPDGYAVSIQHALPPGFGLANELPKVRIFHLPSAAARERLEQILATVLGKKYREENAADSHSDMADRIERIATEIDKQSERVTGGLLVIGGVIAIANPLLGVGIAAKALFPSVGSKVTNEALRFVGEKLRISAKRSADEQAVEKATGEVKKLKPVVHTNPLLSTLEAALCNDDPDHDPAAQAVAPDRFHALTVRAIVQTYTDILTQDDPPADARLHGYDIGWLRALSRTKL
jgi:hypothetical protein